LAAPDVLRECGSGKREVAEKERGRGDRGWEERGRGRGEDRGMGGEDER